MFFLVKFEGDNLLYICSDKRISSISDRKCIVRYEKGGRYPAEILAKNGNQQILEELKIKEEAESSKYINALEASEESGVVTLHMQQSECSNSFKRNSENETVGGERAPKSIFNKLHLPVYCKIPMLPIQTVIEKDCDYETENHKDRIDAPGYFETERMNVGFQTSESNVTSVHIEQSTSLDHVETGLEDEAVQGDETNVTVNNKQSNSLDLSTMSMEEEIIRGITSEIEWIPQNLTLINNISSSSLFDENDEYILMDLTDNSIKNINTSIGQHQETYIEGADSAALTGRELEQVESIETQLEYTNIDGNAESEKPSCRYDTNKNVLEEGEGDFSDFEDSGSEYQLSESGSDSTSENEESQITRNRSSELSTTITPEEVNLVDDWDMFVLHSGDKSKQKKLFCMYCNKFQSKFARHLETVHKDLMEIKKFIHMKKGCKERKQIIDTIKKNCQFHYNTNYLLNDGELIVSRRPHKNLKKQAKDFKACQNCKGFFTKNNIRHHAAKCFSYNGKNHRSLLVMGRKLESRIHPEASDILRKIVFPVLREDNVVRCIRYDRLLILYGNKMCCKYRLQHQQDLIRSNLRVLGRFLLTLKDKNKNIKEFSDIYDTDVFNDVINAINDVAGFDEINQTYRTPSTAYNLGSLIKKIGNIYISDCIRRKDRDRKVDTEEFLKVLNEDLATTVNKTVTETQTQQYRRKRVDLPSKDDIHTMHKHLTTRMRKAFANLKNSSSYEEWMNLAKITLISIQLFNRRRAGELERIFIEDYETHESISDDLLQNLSIESLQTAKKYVRFYIRGKLNRSVPVLLSQEMKRSIDVILKYRKAAAIPNSNKYVFGLPGDGKCRQKYLRACKLMREFADECGAKFPSTLRGTKLRKHVATNCINLNLSENEITDVANFMGHSKEIHRQHYRQPIISREILRMSRVLEKAQGSEDPIDRENSDQSSECDSDDRNGCNKEQIISNEISHRNENRKSTPKKKKRSTSPFGPVKRKKRWTVEENETAMKLFKDNIKNESYPSLKQIQTYIQENPVLRNRSPCVVKTWISNKIKIKKSKF